MERRNALFAITAGVCFAAVPRVVAAHHSGSTDDVVDIIFDQVERVIIEEYFGEAAHGSGLPPGLAKRDKLPPGLQRQIERNGTLPPGLRTYDLPPGLIDRLPPVPRGTQRVIVGNDVVLIREGTRYILDVIKDVLTQ